MPRTGLSGNLHSMSLPDLLRWIGAGRKTGTLSIRNESIDKKIFFLEGAITGSSSNDPLEFLGQILLSDGSIDEQQLKDAFDAQRRTKVMLGRVLAGKGLLKEQKVAEALRLKTEETIYSLFLCTDANFEFLEEEAPPCSPVTIALKVEEILMEGLRRYDTSKKIRQVLPENSIVLTRTGTQPPAEVLAKPFQKRIIELVDGRRTLADIILEMHSPEFNVCQVLYVMVQTGYVRIRREEEAPQPSPTPTSSRMKQPVEHLMDAANDLIKAGDAEEALVVLEEAQRGGHDSAELGALVQVAERYFIERAYRHYLPPNKIPILKKPLESLTDLELSPQEFYLVSRVNGSWDLRSIMAISPLREVDALRALKKLREAGIIELEDAQAKTA